MHHKVCLHWCWARRRNICTAPSCAVNVHPQVLRHKFLIQARQALNPLLSTGGAFEEEFEEAAPVKKELFYTEGPASLKQARLQFAHFSLDRAASRLAGAKRKRESPDEDEEAERADTVSLMTKVCACMRIHVLSKAQRDRLACDLKTCVLAALPIHKHAEAVCCITMQAMGSLR